MPPFIPRKRPSASPPASSRPTPAKRTKVADVLDAESRNAPSLQRGKTFSIGGSDDSDSSLSDVERDQFEDVSSKVKQPSTPVQEHEDEDEDIEWEDAGGHDHLQELPEYKPTTDGPIEIKLRKRDDEGEGWLEQAAAKIKKGPSKRDKKVRICAHQLHVQFLLWHNAVRNKWTSDREVQQILVQQLPAALKREVEQWKRASGMAQPEQEEKTKPQKGKKRGKQKATNPRSERDWGRPSQRLEKGKPDMSNGDPLIFLVKVLAAYWKKNFTITAPGLRKRGYGTIRDLRQTIQSQKHDEHDPEQHGERVRDIHEFRELARKREGSRDVGAQLFTALLRGLGVEARMVASLQPSGYGWTKAEQMLPRKAAKPVTIDTSSDESDYEVADAKSISDIAKPSGRRKGRGKRAHTELESTPDEDDDSVVEVTPAKRKKQPQKYDRDNPFPIYWTEAISPVTNKVLAVSPLVLASPVATNPEILSTFEPRGIKADKTKTVMAYVIAYSSDGTAKDVTVRYIKKQIWPGKTKGFRFPIEKIPIYNKHGKIKRYEDYDWFKRVMSLYTRPDLMRTAVDDLEDATNLVPQLAEEKDTGQDGDTLQSLKSSADFVLERFLRREEALRPEAQPVRTFTSGKGENVKEEPVYLRSDVERCLTAESWHKEGRRPKAGEAPMKLVPVRAVTLTRKREAEEHQRMTGEKQMQGLYSWDQTEYIVPPPIKDGIIPKNAYGNIDCFVPSMVPKGAVHIPLRGTVRICKKLEVDFAEAVTGFEFGNKRAVPVSTGVVVAKEHEKKVREAWKIYNEEQKRKEEKKVESLVLEMWRKFVVGLRIRERVRDTYGEGAVDELGAGRSMEQPVLLESEDEKMAGPSAAGDHGDDEFAGGGGFLPESDEEPEASDLEVGFHPNDDRDPEPIVGKGKERAAEAEYPTPASVSPLKPPLRRQRPAKSLLLEAEDGESSDLSAAPSGDDRTDAVSEDEREDDQTATREKGPEEQDEDSDAGEREDEDESDDDSDSDDYRPTKTKSSPSTRKSRRQSTKATPQPPAKQRQNRTSTRRARKAASSPAAEIDMEDEDEDDSDTVMSRAQPKSKPKARGKSAAKRATPKKRTLRRDSTLVTSPYFA